MPASVKLRRGERRFLAFAVESTKDKGRARNFFVHVHLPSNRRGVQLDALPRILALR